MTLDEIVGDHQKFLRTLLEQVRDAGFDLNDFVQIDHMCYRTVSQQNYELKKRQLARVGRFLRETMVNARPISVFRLNEPVRFEGWRIDAVELPAPKAGRDWEEGLEHVEFVLYDDFETFLLRHRDMQFDLKAADRGINPEIGYSLGRYGVKFHLLNLPAVVFLEQKLGIDKV